MKKEFIATLYLVLYLIVFWNILWHESSSILANAQSRIKINNNK